MITVARFTHLALAALAAVPLPIWVFAGLLLGCIAIRVAGAGHHLDALVDLGEAGDRDEYHLTDPEAPRA